MKAQELYVKVGEEFRPTGKFFCAKCRRTSITQSLAEACGVCDRCKEKPSALHKAYCDLCLEKYHAEEKAKRQALFDDAEEVTDYEFVWWSEACVPDVQEILDDCMYDDLKDLPEFVFAMKPIIFRGFEVSQLFDDFDEDSMCEDFTCKDVLVECDVLEEAVRAFNDTNKKTKIFWQEDTTRKVRIPKSEESEV